MSLATVVKAGDLFEGLDGEREQMEDRNLRVVRSEGLDAIIHGYQKLIDVWDDISSVTSDLVEENYFVATIAVPQHYTARDITGFSIGLKEFEKTGLDLYATGLYLSALINKSKEKKHKVVTFHLCNRLEGLGAFLDKKHVVVLGNTGAYTGDSMISGKLDIKGFVCNEGLGGEMKGGIITAEDVSLSQDIALDAEGGIIRLTRPANSPEDYLPWLDSRANISFYVGNKRLMVRGKVSQKYLDKYVRGRL